MHPNSLRLFVAFVLVCLVALPSALIAGQERGGGEAAFEKLKMLEGTWKEPGGTPENPQVHIFEVSAAGTVVQETMAPGTAYEMINMYHLDGDTLMLTHYCAGGNQPRMKMVDGDLSKMISFEYFDGTNVDPAKDAHIHRGKIVFVDNDSIESHWTSYKEGEENGSMVIKLTRTGD